MDTLEQIKGGVVVSCQALENEPLHSSFIMGRMALAAKKAEQLVFEQIRQKISMKSSESLIYR